MSNRQDDIENIIVSETDIRPNRFSIYALSGIILVLAICFGLNSIDVFEIDKTFMALSFGITMAIYMVMIVIANDERRLANRKAKYLIMFMTFVIMLILSVLLNINATLALLMPMMLATQYRSKKISKLALIYSFLICLIAPILSFLLKTYSYTFLSGYLETVCGMHIKALTSGSFTTAQSVGRILLYLVLPQEMVIISFGFILSFVTDNGISSLQNEIEVLKLQNSLKDELKKEIEIKDRIFYSLSEIIEGRDFDTGDHVKRTSRIVTLLTRQMLSDKYPDFDETYAKMIIKASPLHDIGKITISDVILNKPGKLTAEEFEEIKNHTIRSRELIEKAFMGIDETRQLKISMNMAMHHHERYDGTGYPDRLKGDDIPLEARIMAIADVYDALVTKRVYKDPFDKKQAYEIIIEGMGSQFDPGLEKYFVACIEDIEAVYVQED